MVILLSVLRVTATDASIRSSQQEPSLIRVDPPPKRLCLHCGTIIKNDLVILGDTILGGTILKALFWEALFWEALFWEALFWEALFWEALFWEALFWEALFWEAPFWGGTLLMCGMDCFLFCS